MDTATPPNTDTTQETGKLVFTEPTVKTFSVPMGRGKEKRMSVSLWRYDPEKCDGKPCCGDCDERGEEDDGEEM